MREETRDGQLFFRCAARFPACICINKQQTESKASMPLSGERAKACTRAKGASPWDFQLQLHAALIITSAYRQASDVPLYAHAGVVIAISCP